MKAWTSLTDTSVVKTYREVPALKTTHFANSRVSEICCLATSLLVFKISNPACEKVVTFVALLNHPSLRFFGMGGLRCALTVFGWLCARDEVSRRVPGLGRCGYLRGLYRGAHW
jgi:hypothetical protein